MRHVPRAVLALCLTTALGACDGDAEADLETGIPVGNGTPTIGAAPDTAAAVGSAAVSLEVDSLGPGAPYLTDDSGRALYLIEGAPTDSATCYDACAGEWPPLIAETGAPSAGAPAVQEALIGTVQRRDGRMQVTYGGHALYYYHDDTGPGMTTGQDVTDQWGEWYLVRPDGDLLETSGG